MGQMDFFLCSGELGQHMISGEAHEKIFFKSLKFFNEGTLLVKNMKD